MEKQWEEGVSSKENGRSYTWSILLRKEQHEVWQGPRYWKFLKEMWKTVTTTWVEAAKKGLLFYFEKLNFLLK